MFSEALFTIVKTWKQSGHPLTEEWEKKMWYFFFHIQIYNGIFSSVQLLSRVRLCDPMDYSTPGLLVHHQLLKFT